MPWRGVDTRCWKHQLTSRRRQRTSLCLGTVARITPGGEKWSTMSKKNVATCQADESGLATQPQTLHVKHKKQETRLQTDKYVGQCPSANEGMSDTKIFSRILKVQLSLVFLWAKRRLLSFQTIAVRNRSPPYRSLSATLPSCKLRCPQRSTNASLPRGSHAKLLNQNPNIREVLWKKIRYLKHLKKLYNQPPRGVWKNITETLPRFLCNPFSRKTRRPAHRGSSDGGRRPLTWLDVQDVMCGQTIS